MKALALRISLIGSLLIAVALVGTLPTQSDTRPLSRDVDQGRPLGDKADSARRPAAPLSYRSPGASHKLIVSGDDKKLEQEILASGAARRALRYGSYTVIEVTDAGLRSLDADTLERLQVRDDLNLVMLRRGQIDTTGPEPQISDDLRQPRALPRSLHLVQLFGPPAPDSVAALKATGAKVISYVPNNAYLIWASAAQLERVRDFRDVSGKLQWEGPFHPAYKLDPYIKLDSEEEVRVSIEIVDAPQSDRALNQVRALARKVLMPEFRASGTVHLKVLIESFRLREVARIPEVMLVEPWSEIKLKDERANQIVAGTLAEETINNIRVGRPARPGFLAFLNSLGFNSDFDFAVDIADTGFDSGAANPSTIHPDFLNAAGQSRVAYTHDFASDSFLHPDNPEVLPAHDALGHGTINASIVGGLNTKTGSAFNDSLGFNYGLGVSPFVRIGVSKLFDDEGNLSTSFSYADFILLAYRGGARITSNSWGACNALTGFCNLYSADSSVFDSFVRDADPEQGGNQGMTVVFASGNDGVELNAAILSPGTAKNVITVGASENFRPTDSNGNNLLDGCGVGGRFADNALDVAIFSAGGPVQDGRAKPDILAPGTHVLGAAPQDRFYANKEEGNLGVCNRYFPEGQTLYTWSSGTSHATPIVAGGAALAYQWLRTRTGTPPSPALIKAFMLNSTTYVTGELGGDSLPGTRQGWGLLNLAQMFEQTDRVVYDEAEERTFTASGGEPFEVTGVIADPSKEFRVMLVYTDAPGGAFSNAPYINQLNLEVVAGGVVYDGNHFSGQYSAPGGSKDFLNNVQGVRLRAGATNSFVVRVRPTIIAGDGVPGNGVDLDQNFALVITNGREAAVPVLSVTDVEGISEGVTVQHSSGVSDAYLIPGERAKITLTLKNLSRTAAAAAAPAALTVLTAEAGSGQSGQSSFPAIEPGGSAANPAPFEIQIPSDLRCGSVGRLELLLETATGRVRLQLGVRVGRPVSPGLQTLVEDDVDSGRVRWKLKKGFSVAAVGNSGASSYHAVDPGKEEEDSQLSSLTMKKKVSIPSDAGNVRLSFFHIFNFEPGFDGGVAEISTDGGLSWQDLGSRVLSGGYDGKVTAASTNPLGDRFAWTSRGRPGVFSQVVINLDDFAGRQVRLRFLAGFDGATGVREGYTGWFIDDIRITSTSFNCR